MGSLIIMPKLEVLELFVLKTLYSFSRAPITKHHQWAWLNTQIYSLSVWMLEVRNQGFGRARLLLQVLRKHLSLPLSTFWWLLAVLDIPWLVAAPLQSLPLSSHSILSYVSLLCRYIQISFLLL